MITPHEFKIVLDKLREHDLLKTVPDYTLFIKILDEVNEVLSGREILNEAEKVLFESLKTKEEG